MPCGRTWICLRPILTLYPLNPIIRLTYYSPSLLRSALEGQNINWLSIGLPHPKVRLSLGTPNPPMIAIAEETSGFRRSGLSPDLRLLIPTFSLLNAPVNFTVGLHSIENAPLPLDELNHRIHNFGIKLSPVTFSAHLAFRPKTDRVVSYYALFKGWLLLSQPPTCLRQNTSFNT